MWGDQYPFEEEIEDQNALIEIVRQKPLYMAVVHPARKNRKISGLIVLTSKTLTPKCLTCSSRGQNFCFHLKIHRDKINKEAQEDTDCSDDDGEEILLESQRDVVKALQSKRLAPDEPNNCGERGDKEDDKFNPFRFSGPASNVFNIKINFLPSKQEEIKNREISQSGKFFEENILIPPYLGKDDTFAHGR